MLRILKMIFDDTREFSEGLAGVKVGDKWGYINKKGEVVIDFQFDDCLPFSEGLAPVGSLWSPMQRKLYEQP